MANYPVEYQDLKDRLQSLGVSQEYAIALSLAVSEILLAIKKSRLEHDLAIMKTRTEFLKYIFICGMILAYIIIFSMLIILYSIR